MEDSGHCSFRKIKTGMLKFKRISKTLLEQIEKGDFSLSGLPSERILAESLSANRLTVQKALALLADKGVIHKLTNGRYAISPKPGRSAQVLRIAILVPPCFTSGNILMWYEAIRIYSEKNNFFFRPFLFVHWNDASISNILGTFDGIFIIPAEEEIPRSMLNKLQSTNGLVMLNTDMSQADILSLCLFPKIFVRQALDRLVQLGHKSIACLHIQSDISDVLMERISQWKRWGELSENDAPLIKADINALAEGDMFLDLEIKKGCLKDSTAVFCTTIHAAIALIRACKNNGIDPEKELSICTIDDEGIGMHSTPSVSCFRRPDIQKLLHPIFNWIRSGGDVQDWKDPLLVGPSSLEVYEGETSHSPVRTEKIRSR